MKLACSFARRLLLLTAIGVFASGCAQPVTKTPKAAAPDGEPTPMVAAPIEEMQWRNYLAELPNEGFILIDTDRRRLAFWSGDGSTYREYPVGVARADELLRTGVTRVVRRRRDPDWRPTPSMRRINPGLPAVVPPGPDNPLGAFALYLDWTYYAIHGTNDPISVGRASTSGCFRLLASHIEWLYRNVPNGAVVRVI